jgi:hypothetical protein
MLGVQTATRQQLLDYFDNTWTLTEVLFSGLLVCGRCPSMGAASFSRARSFVCMGSRARAQALDGLPLRGTHPRDRIA